MAACLPSARHVLGTRWQPEYRGRVVVLDTPEPPYGLAQADADLTHLRLAGCLDDLAALVVCRPYRFAANEAVALHRLVLEQVADFEYPILARVEGGHTDPMPTLPIGVDVTIDGDELIIDGPAVA
jgi:muramoyltetrapeptide carboxypeptidase